jgi:multisubunit Na+/H+ antiporter MnhB subunit
MARGINAIMVLALALALLWAIGNLPAAGSGLSEVVAARMERSGVEHPVTAVLLNFRGYDTWLELGVLILAILGVLGARQQRDLSSAEPVSRNNPVLVAMLRWMFPILLVFAGYLLWRGKFAAGGAFQAGVLLAAGAVLLWLVGFRSVAALPRTAWAAGISLGFIAFLAAAVYPLGRNAALLQYPEAAAGTWILLIEAAAMISIALTLASLFIALQPRPDRPPAETPAP